MKPNFFSKVITFLGDKFSKNSPTIFAVVAVGGIIGTAIFAVDGTIKACTICSYDKDCKPTKKQIFKKVWKYYIPMACTAVITAACVLGSNSINKKRNAALATMYGLTDVAFREYKEKVVETIGKNKELKLRDEIDGDHIKKNPPTDENVLLTRHGEVLCYDSLSGRYFKSDIEWIRKAINDINKDFLSEMWVSLNELYYAFGLSGTKLGDMLGWDLEQGLVEVNFSSQLSEEGKPCLVLNYVVMPRFMI